jgi:soluble lytic murein transglycosylase-like protein
MKQGIALILACSAALGVSGCQSIDTTATTGSVAQPAAAVAAVAGASAKETQYTTIVSHYAASYGVPAPLAKAVVQVESGYNPQTRGSHGEVGLMQIKPSTARMMGYSGTTKGLYDPQTNVEYGMRYLAMAQSLGDGTTCGTLLRYNAGHAARRMNPVSAHYCAAVKSVMARN